MWGAAHTEVWGSPGILPSAAPRISAEIPTPSHPVPGTPSQAPRISIEITGSDTPTPLNRPRYIL